MSIDYSLQGSVAVVVIDDGRANAIGPEVIEGVTAALERSERDAARAVVIAGRPGRFSAGFDLAIMQSGDGPLRQLVGAGAELTARILLHPVPVVAACTGHALAAGALLLLASDTRIGAAGEFKIGLNEVAIGMAMPQWGVELASYRIPPSVIDQCLVLGQVVGPQEAVAAGFLDRLVSPDEVVDEAVRTASSLAELRSGAVAGTKNRLRGPLADRMLSGIDADLSTISLG